MTFTTILFLIILVFFIPQIKYSKKIPIIITVIFVIMAVFIACTYQTDYENVITVNIITEYGKQEITPWYDDGNIYIFLPSYIQTDDTQVVFDTTKKVRLDGDIVDNGIIASNITFDEEHTLSIGRQKYNLIIYQSENVGTIYINTATGSMEEIYDDKEHEEPVSVTVIDETGTVDYNSKDCTLKGRGNSTWDYKDKKPFSLKLNSASKILGMDSSKSWALLANGYDVTNMRDKLVKDFAKRLELSYATDEQYVDLYLNGEYNGLYLIAQKIDTGENNLCTFEFSSRWNLLENPIKTSQGQVVEVKYPKTCTGKKLEQMASHIQQMEDAIMDENASIDEVIDIDSWARMYLIEEIFEDVDVNIASSYFYWSDDDGIIYSGPEWDFDRSIGSDVANSNPETFFAKRVWRSLGYYVPYYDALLKHEDFRNRVIELYYDEFAPLLEDMFNNKVSELASRIGKASDINYIRWNALYSIDDNNANNIVYNAEGIINYLEKRYNFLNNNISDISDYEMVHLGFNADHFDYIIAVKNGESIKLPDLEAIGIKNLLYWVDNTTGEEFDISQPITDDVELRAVIKSNDSSLFNKILNDKSKLVYGGMVVLLILILAVLVLIDVNRNKRGGKIAACMKNFDTNTST